MGGRVKKPCPACKTTESTRPDADSICYKCQRIFNEAKEMIERDSKIDKTEVMVSTCERYYALPNFYHLSKHALLSSKNNELLQRSFFKLISGLVRREVPGMVFTENSELLPVPPMNKGDRREWQLRVVMNKNNAEAINDLDAAIRAALKETADQAYQNGKDLLMGIASGDLSMNKLNEATIGEES